MAAMENVSPPTNIKHATLVAINDKIITSIAGDPLDVAQTLFAKGMILLESWQQAENKTRREKASELMGEVLMRVESFPDNFDLFVEVIKERLWLKNTVELIHSKLEVSAILKFIVVIIIRGTGCLFLE
jgi:hypothetical protein